ncbi:hypothetical protein J437_LFUL013427, partial [Ladona fulva]
VPNQRNEQVETNPDPSHPGLRSRFSNRRKAAPDADTGHRTEKDRKDLGSGMGIYTPETLSWRRLHVSRSKLKEAVSSSTILCAFALESMVELQVKAPTGCPSWLFTLFAVNTTTLISVHILAAMISTYILPSIESVHRRQSRWESSALDPSMWDVDPSESPHDSLRGFVEMAWIFSSVIGLFLFLTEVSLLSWVKFWDVSFSAAASGSAAVTPFMIMSVVFCLKFHKVLAGHTYEMRELGLKQVEDLKQQLDRSDTSVKRETRSSETDV